MWKHDPTPGPTGFELAKQRTLREVLGPELTDPADTVDALAKDFGLSNRPRRPHYCHAHGCIIEVAPKMFMCRKHWYMVPRKLRDAIWAEYKTGQERTKTPTLRYLAVQQRAIGEVAFRPNDEAAAAIAAPFILNAEAFRQKAIAAGHGDPFEGVL